MSRISQLPQRDWQEHAVASARKWTKRLRREQGTQVLRPAQGASLQELSELGGLFSAILVGGGKTLISFLVPVVLKAERPVLLVPGGAALIKTERELREAAEHWQVPEFLPVRSYNFLHAAKNAEWLWEYQPTLVICDESQRLKRNNKAASARRLIRYANSPEGKQCKFLFLSGSPTLNGVEDFAQLMILALGDRAPVPLDPHVLSTWGAILNAAPNEQKHYSVLAPEIGKCSSVEDARSLIGARICRTPGVIVSDTGFDHPFQIEEYHYDVPAEIRGHLRRLSRDWELPDGYPLTAAPVVSGSAQRLGAGFAHLPDPRPPERWLDARRGYSSLVRKILERSEFDTELQVRQAIESGSLPGEAFWRWSKIKSAYTPAFRVEWYNKDLIPDQVNDWLDEIRGLKGGRIIWVQSSALGRHLSRRFKVPFFGSSATHGGVVVDQCKAPLIVCSLSSCSDGFNLQYQYSHALFTQCPAGAQRLEQALGRIHRPEQPHPCTARILIGNYSAAKSSWAGVLRQAEYAQGLLKLPQKILQFRE